MQLTPRPVRTKPPPRTRTARHAVRAAVIAALLGVVSSGARADAGMDVTATAFHEGGGNLNMTVLTPSASAHADLGSAVGIDAGWQADVVSGASVAVVDAPSGAVDAISSATTLTDVRQQVGGDFQLKSAFSSLTAGYSYDFENDYRSHTIHVSGRTDLFDRDTTLEVSYVRGIDSVCDLYQPRAQSAVVRQRLPTSKGCFSAADRTSDPLDLHTFQGSWTQAWAPIFTTQLTLTAQLLHGQQGNPYRAVWLGVAAAQEHHPQDRARYAAGLGLRLWIKPLHGALRAYGRLYRDTWGIESVTGKLAYEQDIGGGLRLRVRGRYYTQTGAVFYSDDYGRFPKGQYFTGDRELSPMSSTAVGGRITWTIPGDENGDVLGFLSSLDLVASADWLFFTFDHFHYGHAAVPNNQALMGTVSVEAGF